MEHIKNNRVKMIIMSGVKSIIETIWAIGTSIAGADALKEKFH